MRNPLPISIWGSIGRATNPLMPILLVVLVLGGAATARAQTTSFTFTNQSQLTQVGDPVNGNVDLQFGLWDSLSGGTQIGATQSLAAVSVKDGTFSVTLDFGAAAFPGADRFMEVAVRFPNDQVYTTLTPRQQILSVPYAIRSLSAGTADTATNAQQLSGVDGGNFVQTNDPRLSDARPPTPGSNDYIQNTTVLQADSNFHISGNGRANGTLTGRVVNATSHYNIGGDPVLSTPGTLNIFAGQNAGAANRNGSGNSFFGVSAGADNRIGYNNSFFGQSAGRNNTIGYNNSFFGVGAGLNTTGSNNTLIGVAAGDSGPVAILGDNNSFFGVHARAETSGSNNTLLGANTNVQAFPGPTTLTNATAIGANALVAWNDSLVLGSIKNTNGATTDTNVGIGTPVPTERLTVRTESGSYGFVHTNAFFYPADLNAITVGSFIGGSTGGGWFGTKSNHPFSLFVNNGGPSLTITTGGLVAITNLSVAGGTPLCRNAAKLISVCSSSLRYKTNVQTFIGGLDVVNRLRPISFTWKEGGVRDIGLGAEEVEKVAPILTFRNDKGEIEGVKYNQLSAVFINAFKEQQAQIQQQQEELVALRKLVCRSHPRARVCKN